MPRAQRDLAKIYERINAAESEAAQKWYRNLKLGVLSLEHLPNRCPLTREDPGLRHLHFGRKPHVYRVIFRVLEKEGCVDVLHVRHGAMDEFQG